MFKLKLYNKSFNKSNFGDLGFLFGKLCVMTLVLSLRVKLEHDKGSKLGGCPRIQIYYFHLSVGPLQEMNPDFLKSIPNFGSWESW